MLSLRVRGVVWATLADAGRMVDLSTDAGKAEFPDLDLRVTQLVLPLLVDRPHRATHPRNGLLHMYNREDLEDMRVALLIVPS